MLKFSYAIEISKFQNYVNDIFLRNSKVPALVVIYTAGKSHIV